MDERGSFAFRELSPDQHLSPELGDSVILGALEILQPQCEFPVQVGGYPYRSELACLERNSEIGPRSQLEAGLILDSQEIVEFYLELVRRVFRELSSGDLEKHLAPLVRLVQKCAQRTFVAGPGEVEQPLCSIVHDAVDYDADFLAEGDRVGRVVQRNPGNWRDQGFLDFSSRDCEYPLGL